MADVHTKEIRSKNMAAIKGRNTKPEMLVRRFCKPMAFVANSTIKASLANLISFYQNTKL